MFFFFLIIWKAFLIYYTAVTSLLFYCLTLCVCILEYRGTCPSRHPKLTHLIVFISILPTHRVRSYVLALRLFHPFLTLIYTPVIIILRRAMLVVQEFEIRRLLLLLTHFLPHLFSPCWSCRFMLDFIVMGCLSLYTQRHSWDKIHPLTVVERVSND
jgi:hypothetical protein